MRCFKWFLSGIEFVVRLFGLGAVVATFGLFIFILLDILSRIFLFPLEGTAEISELLLGGSAFLALGYTQRAGMHVRVTALISRLRPKWQAVTDICVELITVALFVLIIWKIGEVTYELWQSQTWSYGTIALPRWIASFMATLGCASLALAVLIGLLPRIGSFMGNRKYGRV